MNKFFLSKDNVINILSTFRDRMTNIINQSLEESKKYTDDKISKIVIQGGGGTLMTLKVNTLPDISDASSNVIYLVPNTEQETDNLYTEYILVDNKWEILGDLSQNEVLSDDDVKDINNQLWSENGGE